MNFDEWFKSLQGTTYYLYYDFAKAAWNAAQAAEREACAKVCDEMDEIGEYPDERKLPCECAAAIRARGKK